MLPITVAGVIPTERGNTAKYNGAAKSGCVKRALYRGQMHSRQQCTTEMLQRIMIKVKN
jgi:hypothetical protein